MPVGMHSCVSSTVDAGWLDIVVVPELAKHVTHLLALPTGRPPQGCSEADADFLLCSAVFSVSGRSGQHLAKWLEGR